MLVYGLNNQTFVDNLTGSFYIISDDEEYSDLLFPAADMADSLCTFMRVINIPNYL